MIPILAKMSGLFKGSDIVKTVLEGADSLFTSKEEKLKLENELTEKLNSHFLEVSKLAQAEAEMYVKDVQNARDMQKAAIASNDWLTRNYLYLLASFIIFSATFFGIALIFVDIPEENKRLVEMFADIYLFGGAVMVLQFFFGSSKGSKDNSDALRKIVNKKTD